MRKNENIKLKDIVAYEKTQMFPWDFTVSYIVTPIYVVVCLLLAAAFGILMEIDDEKFLVQGLLCIGAFALISVILLATVPFIRKKTIRTELELYDFDSSKVEELDVWDFSTEESGLKFDQLGMYIDNELFYYNHISKTVETSNHCKRIIIYLQFAISEEQIITLPVNPTTLKMLECLNIKLDNQNILEYILSNKQEAFKKIYNRGHIAAHHQ